ncbi:MAG: winged helix-turn-helix domain-containing protein [Kangiellaceae bacterium]|nr:winged helix-turn-helix domain-containing protein [Kangiellaceae bacterium]
MNNNQPDNPKATNWRLNQWIAKPEALELIHLQETKKLEPKVMELLCFLIQQPGEVVSPQTLINELWQGVTVSENSVRRLITQLRKALDDDVSVPKFIETIPKRGYKLICKVEPIRLTTNSKPIPKLSMVLAATLILSSTFWYIFTNDDQSKLENLGFNQSEITRLTSIPGEETLPTISSDLSRVYYTHIPRLSNEIEIRVFELDSSEDSQIEGFIGQPFTVSWSPDGSRVAYIDPRSCQVITAQYDVESKSLFNNETISQCKSPYLNRIIWFDNGNEFYLSQYDTEKGIRAHYRYDIARKRMSPLEIGLEKFDWDPRRLSPHPTENQWLVLTQDKNQAVSLWLYRPLTADRRLIHTNLNGSITSSWCINSTDALLFAIDNKLLSFSNDAINSIGEFAIPNFAYLKCAQSKSGKKQVVFSPLLSNTSLIIQSNPMKSATDALPAHHIYRSTQVDTNPMFSKTSNKLAFVSKRKGKWQIWQGNKHVAKLLSKHTFNDPPYIISWSPDETKLLLLINRRPAIMHLPSGEVEKIDLQNSLVSFSYWGRNENELLFSLTEDKRIYSYNLLTEEMSQLTYSDTEDLALSTDNKTLFFTKPKQKGLWKIDLRTNQEKLIYPDFPIHSLFTATSTGIYFHHHQNKEAGLYFYDLNTKQTTTVLSEQTDQGHNFSVSHDQSQLVYMSRESLEADLRMIELSE